MSYPALGETVALTRRIVRRNVAGHPVNALARRVTGARFVALPGGLGDTGLGILPVAAAVGTISNVSRLLNTLGPSHQAQNMRSNKAKFDDLGTWAVGRPNENYAAITGLNPNNRTPTNRTALSWLQQIVNGPGFQGGPGTPFPDNPRDFLIWADKHDAGVAQEWQWASDVLNAVLQTLATTPPPAALTTPPAAVQLAVAPPTIVQPMTTTGPAAPAAPAAPAPGPRPAAALFQPRPVSSRIAPPASSGDQGSGFDQILSAIGQITGALAPQPAAAPAAAPVTVSVTAPTSGPAAVAAPAGGAGIGDFLERNKMLIYGALGLGAAAFLLPRLLPARR